MKYFVVTDSGYQERVDGERKESIRKLMKELSKESEHKMTPKGSTAIQPGKIKSSAEPLLSKTKNCTMRIFRTVS